MSGLLDSSHRIEEEQVWEALGSLLDVLGIGRNTLVRLQVDIRGIFADVQLPSGVASHIKYPWPSSEKAEEQTKTHPYSSKVKVRSVRCPQCGALPGEFCVEPDGSVRLNQANHRARQESELQTSKEIAAMVEGESDV